MTAIGMIMRSGTVWVSGLVCFAALGGFFFWSATAPLAEGVVAYGRVAVENDRQVVQHLEGGIIQEFFVAEGDIVKDGAPLLVLADVAVTAGRDQVAQELLTAVSSVDRLEALLNGSGGLAFAQLPALPLEKDVADEILARQARLFNQQRSSKLAELSVLRSRRQSLLVKAESFLRQIGSTQAALDLVRVDVERNRGLLERQLINARELAALELKQADLSSDLVRLESEQMLAMSEASEITQQIVQVEADSKEAIGRELVEARSDVLSLTENLIAAQDVVNRTTVYAPQGGKVLNLNFTTTGGVVRPGETILEIVPDAPQLIATVEVRPIDRDVIFEGLNVEARLSGLNSWSSPLLAGEVIGISADLKSAPDGTSSFYEAQISLNRAEVEETGSEPLPGMPIEAFIFSGDSRTFLSYIVEPIDATFRRGARE